MESADSLFRILLAVLLGSIGLCKLAPHLRRRAGGQPTEDLAAPPSVRSLRRRFLSVFWLLRVSFWMAGPYFYDVYASKELPPDGRNTSPGEISRIFLAGFASIALFNPLAGLALAQYGPKRGTLAATALYAVGSLSTLAATLPSLLGGRAVGGIGSSLLSSAPELWLVSEFGFAGVGAGHLMRTFSLAYAYDPIVAISAGQLAEVAAVRFGSPTGPFLVSPLFLAVAGIIVVLSWRENQNEVAATPAGGSNDQKATKKEEAPPIEVTIRDGLRTIMADRKLQLLGSIQSLFEAAMYAFVMKWPPVMTAAVRTYFREDEVVPFGTVFSCFMACSMVGSTCFGFLASLKGASMERLGLGMLLVSSLSMAGSVYSIRSGHAFTPLLLSFFAFEGCVGVYFPLIGFMRSQYLIPSHRSMVMTLFHVPLNILVVSICLFVGRLGDAGTFAACALALAAAAACMGALLSTKRLHAKQNWAKITGKVRRCVAISNYIKLTAREGSREAHNRSGSITRLRRLNELVESLSDETGRYGANH